MFVTVPTAVSDNVVFKQKYNKLYRHEALKLMTCKTCFIIYLHVHVLKPRSAMSNTLKFSRICIIHIFKTFTYVTKVASDDYTCTCTLNHTPVIKLHNRSMILLFDSSK